MKRTLIILTLAFLAVATFAFAGGSWTGITLKDTAGSGGTDVTWSNTGGAVTVSNATSVNYGSATVSYASSPTWNLESDQNIFSLTTDSPKWIWTDGSSQAGFILKQDSGGLLINSSNTNEPLDFQMNNDTNDYIRFSTTSNVPQIGTVGAADFYLTAGSSNVVYIRKSYLNVYNEDATNNAVEDMLIIEKQTSGSSASGIGAAVIFKIEDAGDTEEQASIDVVLTTVTNAAEDADFVFRQNGAGVMQETLRLIAKDEAAASDFMQYTGNSSETNGLTDLFVIRASTSGTAANNMGGSIAVHIEDDGGNINETHSLDFQLTTAADGSEDGKFAINLMSADSVVEVLSIQGQSSASAGDVLTITQHTTETNAVLDVLILTNVTGTATTGAGIGIRFSPEDAGGAEEQGSIDLVLTTATDSSEMAAFVLRHQSAGAIVESFRVQGDSSATTGDRIEFIQNTTETDGIIDIMRLKQATTTGANNLGMAISFWLEDDTGAEEHATMEIQQTTAARGTNDTDIFFTQDVNGTLETRVLFDADGPTIHAKGTTPYITIGDSGDEDAYLLIDGQGTDDFHLGFDTTDDDFKIGYGQAMGTTPRLTLADDSETLTLGSTATNDTVVIWNSDGSGILFYMANDNSEDDLVIGVGTTVDTTPAITILGDTQVVEFESTVYFKGGQTKKVIFLPSDMVLDGSNPPSVIEIGTDGQTQVEALAFDADGGSTGDDYAYINWVVPDGYVTNSARLNVFYSFSNAEDASDEAQFDFTINAVAAGETIDAAGTALSNQSTVISDASTDNGKMHITQYNIEVEDIVVDDMVVIEVAVDETASALSASGTLDVHYFEIEYESTE